jgi:hypothetical protein
MDDRPQRFRKQLAPFLSSVAAAAESNLREEMRFV